MDVIQFGLIALHVTFNYGMREILLGFKVVMDTGCCNTKFTLDVTKTKTIEPTGLNLMLRKIGNFYCCRAKSMHCHGLLLLIR